MERPCGNQKMARYNMEIPYQKKSYRLGDGGSKVCLACSKKRQVPVPARPSTLRPRMYVSHVRTEEPNSTTKSENQGKEEGGVGEEDLGLAIFFLFTPETLFSSFLSDLSRIKY